LMQIKKIFVVPYCHADWAWTFHRRWHEKRYVLIFKEVLALCRKHPDFRWYFDTYITQLEPLLRFCPDLLPELRKRIYDGQINICGTFTNLRPSRTGEETQIRDIILGQRIFRKLFPRANLSVYASTIDVSLGHYQMPQLLTLAGYRYFRFWRPHAALSAKKIPLEFYWQGQDGSQILCCRGSYSGLCYRHKFQKGFLEELAYDSQLSPTGLRWLSQGMDDCRPLRSAYEDKEIPIFDFIRKWNRTRKIPIVLATPLEFFQELEKEKHNLPRVATSLDICEVAYNVGWGGQHGLFHYRQENDLNLRQAETYSALATFWREKYPRVEMENLWQQHLVTCSHATQWLFTSDFEEMKNLACYVALSTRRLKTNSLKSIASELSFPAGWEVLLFNPLPYEREENVDLVISFPEKNQNFSLQDNSGKVFLYQVNEINDRGRKSVWEYFLTARVKLPACGFTPLYLSKRKSYFHRKKYLSWKPIWENQELVNLKVGENEYQAPEGSGFGTLKLYHVDTEKGILHVGPVSRIETANWEKTEQKQDGVLFSLWESYGQIGHHSVIRKILFHKTEPRLEFQIEINWQHQDGFIVLEWPRWKESKIAGDIPFGVEEKNLTLEPFNLSSGRTWDTIERQRENLFYAKSFVSQSNGCSSLTYVNHDATGYYLLGDKTISNILHNSVTKLTGWERFLNPGIKGLGQHRFVSHLFFLPATCRSNHLARRAQQLGILPEKISGQCIPAGKEKIKSLLSLAPGNLIFTSFYCEGQEYVLRFYETEGKKTKAIIRLARETTRIYRTNLLGKQREEIYPSNPITTRVKPWEIVTLRFRLK